MLAKLWSNVILGVRSQSRLFRWVAGFLVFVCFPVAGLWAASIQKDGTYNFVHGLPRFIGASGFFAALVIHFLYLLGCNHRNPSSSTRTDDNINL